MGLFHWLAATTRFFLLRHSCVRAEGAKDCGPAALATVAHHYRCRVSLLQLHEFAGTNLQGTHLDGLRRAAERIGFEAAIGVLPLDDIQRVALPFIAHFRHSTNGHFVVVHGADSSGLVIADPAKGIVSLTLEEFAERWSGQVLLLRPSASFRLGRRPRSPWLDLVRTGFAERGFLLPATSLAVSGAFLAYGISFFVRYIVDRVIPAADFGFLETLGLGISVVVVSRTIVTTARQHVLARAGSALALRLGLDYASRLLWLPLRFFESRQSGEVFTRFLDAPKVSAAVTGSLLSVILDLALLVTCALFMTTSSIALTAITVMFGPLVIGVTLLSLPAAKRRERELHERFSNLSNKFVEITSNIRTIKACTAEADAYARLSVLYESMQKSLLSRASLTNWFGAASSLVTGGASVALLWLGALETIDHQLTIGQLMFFYSVLGLFLGSVDRLGPSVAAIQDATSGLERLREIALVPQENSGSLFKIDECRSVTFENVSFGYRPGQHVLCGIDLTIGPGEKLALLGDTGSGKSTLVSLIIGLYEPSAGRLLVNGRAPADVDVTVLRRRIAVVMQDAGLLSGSIRENITLGNGSLSQEDIEKAAGLAQAHEFIMTLPRGYDYEIGPAGTGLSSGQRQRIALARAFARDPSLLILDEATSHLDPETERAVLEELEFARRGRMTIIATHRMAVAARAQRIVVLHGGRITESGTHAELLARGGRYAGMWRAFLPDQQEAAS